MPPLAKSEVRKAGAREILCASIPPVWPDEGAKQCEDCGEGNPALLEDPRT